jgi:hypothetical protein
MAGKGPWPLEKGIFSYQKYFGPSSIMATQREISERFDNRCCGGCHFLSCSLLSARRFLSSCNHRDQIDLRVVRNQSCREMRFRNRSFVDANDRVGIRISGCLEKIGNRHPFAPRIILPLHSDHLVTPLALSTSSTSGKSILRRLTVSTFGIPSAVQPRRL